MKVGLMEHWVLGVMGHTAPLITSLVDKKKI